MLFFARNKALDGKTMHRQGPSHRKCKSETTPRSFSSERATKSLACEATQHSDSHTLVAIEHSQFHTDSDWLPGYMEWSNIEKMLASEFIHKPSQSVVAQKKEYEDIRFNIVKSSSPTIIDQPFSHEVVPQSAELLVVDGRASRPAFENLTSTPVPTTLATGHDYCNDMPNENRTNTHQFDLLAEMEWLKEQNKPFLKLDISASELGTCDASA